MDAIQLEQYRRLKKAGQWKEANALRELLRQALRARGIKRRLAREASWALMLLKFPVASEGVAKSP